MQTKANTVGPAKTTTTLYLFGTYQNDTLQFLPHEEGRVRYELANGNNCPPTSDRFIYDYFIKDHLGDIRMVLTEQNESICYPSATVEDATYQTEQALYDIVDGRRIDKTTTGATESSFGNKLYRVHGGLTNEKVGLGIVLKVMAGDQVKITAESYYTMPGGGPGTPTGTAALSELLSAFVGGSAVSSTHTGLTTTDVSSIGTNSTSITSFLNGNSEGSNNARAFLNYILFDDQMKFVSGGADPVNVGGGYKQHTAFVSSPVSVSKSGYIYVYVSNESNFPVYFDNLAVTHTPGAILETNQYYPFGLVQQGISSSAATTLVQNKKKYNGIDWQNDLGLNEYDAFYRTLDAQTARWWQIDPQTDGYENLSPYASMYDDPMKISDPLGNEGDDCCNWWKIAAWVQDKIDHPSHLMTEAGQRNWNALSNTVSKAVDNAVTNFKNGNDGFHRMTAMGPGGVITGMGPLAASESLLMTETKSLMTTEAKTLVNNEVKEAAKLEKYQVGTYNDLKKLSTPNDGLDIHHAPQSQPSKRVVQGYDKKNAPSIALPASEHKAIPVLKGTATAGTARQQLAKDVRDLRNYTNAPPGNIERIIEMTKKQYPASFKKN